MDECAIRDARFCVVTLDRQELIEVAWFYTDDQGRLCGRDWTLELGPQIGGDHYVCLKCDKSFTYVNDMLEHLPDQALI